MWVPPACEADFQSWEATSLAFWHSLRMDREPETGTDRGWIYVDLMHDNADYVLRSLTTAGYLARITGGRLVALVGAPGAVPRSCASVDPDRARRAAAAFDISLVEAAPESGDDLASFLQHLCEAAAEAGLEGVGGLRGARLRSLLPQVRRDGLPIGAYAYETFLRSELQPTLDTLSAPFLTVTSGCLAVDDWIRGLFATRPPAWFVTGHADYNPWGIIGWRALESGARLCWFSVHGPMGARLLSGPPPDDGGLSRLARQDTAALFESAIWPRNRDARDAVVAFHRRRRSGRFHRTWNVLRQREHALAADTRDRIARALRTRLGLPPERPVVAILCHAMTDTPRADRQSHADYGQWLSDTLAFAAEHPERSWLVKPHPRDELYDSTGCYRKLAERYADVPHIRFGGIEDDVWPLVCDVATTVRGTPGIEYASLGVPVVLAGHSLYSDHGFCRVADSEEAYHALLVAPPDEFALSAEAVERAQLHLYAESFAFCVTSPLLPPFGERFAEASYWRDRAIALNWFDLADDPFFHALEDAVRRSLPRTLAPSFRSGSPEAGTALAKSAEEAVLTPTGRHGVLPVLVPGERQPMNRNGKGLDYVLCGYLAAEPDRAWMTSDPILMALPLPDPGPAGMGFELELEATAFVVSGNPRVVLDILFDGRMADQMVFETPASRTLRLPVPPESISKDGILIIALSGHPACRPADLIPGNGDTRSLSVGLIAMTIHTVGG
ncbi:hypothetical protein JJL56_32375 [Azospirillum sp. YIM DDC1]|uniref:Capsular biosynthesis protein n=1 Tax=Azospirillum aestuarii TaxID=2802052 RepID=A0ABS1I8Z2_9PROT|nr:hypothetical protein [Azospirillum aestuarii]MBK4723539.1 hypothetical protein [Azospirillum aestuarii]